MRAKSSLGPRWLYRDRKGSSTTLYMYLTCIPGFCPCLAPGLLLPGWLGHTLPAVILNVVLYFILFGTELHGPMFQKQFSSGWEEEFFLLQLHSLITRSSSYAQERQRQTNIPAGTQERQPRIEPLILPVSRSTRHQSGPTVERFTRIFSPVFSPAQRIRGFLPPGS